ncbi:MAG: LOG family protein, partial [Candidatus Omnitrophica bacterium]|nr:LOG family protein [Candidatus Omnitrophota bacterium]
QNVPIAGALTWAIPHVEEAVKDRPVKWFKMAMQLGTALIQEENILPCPILALGIPAAAEASEGREDQYAQNLSQLKSWAVVVNKTVREDISRRYASSWKEASWGAVEPVLKKEVYRKNVELLGGFDGSSMGRPEDFKQELDKALYSFICSVQDPTGGESSPAGNTEKFRGLLNERLLLVYSKEKHTIRKEAAGVLRGLYENDPYAISVFLSNHGLDPVSLLDDPLLYLDELIRAMPETFERFREPVEEIHRELTLKEKEIADFFRALPESARESLRREYSHELKQMGLSSSPAKSSVYRQTILPAEARAQARHTEVRRLLSKTLELAYERYEARDVGRRLGALKRSLRSAGLARAEEIIRFIEAGNEMAATWILAGLAYDCAKQRRELLSERLERIKSRQKIEEGRDGKVTVLMGRFVEKEGAAVLEQKPERRTLYRWHRIFDQVFESLATETLKTRKHAEALADIEHELEGDPSSAEMLATLAAIAVSMKGVRVEEKKQARQELELAVKLIQVGRFKPAREAVGMARSYMDLRLAAIDGEMAHLQQLRLRLRELGEARFEKVAGAASRLRAAVAAGNMAQARDDMARLLHLPYLWEPDFVGARNIIVRTQEILGDIVIRRAKAAAAGKEATTIPQQQKASENIGYLAEIVREGRFTNHFMIAYQSLWLAVCSGQAKGYKDADAVFEKVFLNWSKDHQMLRGSPEHPQPREGGASSSDEGRPQPGRGGASSSDEGRPQMSRYWHARLYKTVFISERSPAFRACDSILFVLKVRHFGTLIPVLRRNDHKNLLRVLAQYLSRKITFGKQIPEDQRDAFIKELLEAAATDYELSTTAEDKDIRALYKAFGISQNDAALSSPAMPALRRPEITVDVTGRTDLDIDKAARVLLPSYETLRAVNVILHHADIKNINRIAVVASGESYRAQVEDRTLRLFLPGAGDDGTINIFRAVQRDLGWDLRDALRHIQYHAPHLLALPDDFGAINVILHARMAGLGDVVFVANAAQIFATAFPDKKVRLIFHQADDFLLAVETKIIKGLNPELKRQQIDGVEVINASGSGRRVYGEGRRPGSPYLDNAWSDIQDGIVGENDVSVVYALGGTEKEIHGYDLTRYGGKARAQLYVYELGFESLIQKPLEHGEAHLGFGPDEAGAAPVSPVSKDIYSKKYPRISERIRQERRRIIQKFTAWQVLDTTLGQKDLERTVASEWGFLYVHQGQSVGRYFGIFERARSQDASYRRKDTTFFIMCGRKDKSVRDEIARLADAHDYNLFEFGNHDPFLEVMRVSRNNNVTIILDYSVPRKLFNELFLYSDDLPSVVSGQDNLANVLYMNVLSSGRPFFWEVLIFQATAALTTQIFISHEIGNQKARRLAGLWDLYSRSDEQPLMFSAPRQFRTFFKEIALALEEHPKFLPQMYYAMLRQVRQHDLGRSRDRAEELMRQLEPFGKSSPALARSSPARQKYFSMPPDILVRELQKERLLIDRIHSLWPAAVIVFGSARIPRDDAMCQEAYEFGTEVYNARLSLRTGAGPSMMEEPLRGYLETRASAGDIVSRWNRTQGIRIYFDPRKIHFEQKTSPYVEECHEFCHFVTRKMGLFNNSIGIGVFPGGFGTLDEFFEVWARNGSLVLIGSSYWKPIMGAFQQSWEDYGLMSQVPFMPFVTNTPRVALAHIKRHAMAPYHVNPKRTRDANAEIAASIKKLSGWLPSVTFIGHPQAASEKELAIAQELAWQITHQGVPVRIGSGSSLLARRLAKGARPHYDLLQATLYIDIKGFMPKEENVILSRHISNHHVVLAENSRDFVFVPGGLGTMNRLFDIVALMQTHKIPRRPLVLVGRDFWERIKETFIHQALSYPGAPLIKEEDAELLQIVNSADEALRFLEPGLRYSGSDENGEGISSPAAPLCRTVVSQERPSVHQSAATRYSDRLFVGTAAVSAALGVNAWVIARALLFGAATMDTGGFYVAFCAIAAVIWFLRPLWEEPLYVKIGRLWVSALTLGIAAGTPLLFGPEGALAAVSVIACLAIHESGHAAAARIAHIPVRDVRIDLLIGAVNRDELKSYDKALAPRSSLIFFAGGPIASLFTAAVSAAIFVFGADGPEAASGILEQAFVHPAAMFAMMNLLSLAGPMWIFDPESDAAHMLKALRKMPSLPKAMKASVQEPDSISSPAVRSLVGLDTERIASLNLPQSQGHVENVVVLTESIGRAFGLKGRDLCLLKYLALGHDIGKNDPRIRDLFVEGRIWTPEDALRGRLHSRYSIDTLEQEFDMTMVTGEREVILWHNRTDAIKWRWVSSYYRALWLMLLIADNIDARIDTSRNHKRGQRLVFDPMIALGWIGRLIAQDGNDRDIRRIHNVMQSLVYDPAFMATANKAAGRQALSPADGIIFSPCHVSPAADPQAMNEGDVDENRSSSSAAARMIGPEEAQNLLKSQEILDQVYLLEYRNMPGSWRWKKAEMEAVVRDEENLFFLLEKDGGFIGYAVFEKRLRMLSRLVVAVKKASLGSTLLERVLDRLGRAGFVEFVITPVNNSRDFYYTFARKRPALVSAETVGLNMIKYTIVPDLSSPAQRGDLPFGRPRPGRTEAACAERFAELRSTGFAGYRAVRPAETPDWLAELLHYYEIKSDEAQTQRLKALIVSGKLLMSPPDKEEDIFFGISDGDIYLVALHGADPAVTLAYLLGSPSKPRLRLLAEEDFMRHRLEKKLIQASFADADFDLVAWGQNLNAPDHLGEESKCYQYLVVGRSVSAGVVDALYRSDSLSAGEILYLWTLNEIAGLGCYLPTFYHSLSLAVGPERLEGLHGGASMTTQEMVLAYLLQVQTELTAKIATLDSFITHNRGDRETLTNKIYTYNRLTRIMLMAGLIAPEEAWEMEYGLIDRMPDVRDLLIFIKMRLVDYLRRTPSACGRENTVRMFDGLSEAQKRRFGYVAWLRKNLGDNLVAVVAYGSSVTEETNYSDYDNLLIVRDLAAAYRVLKGRDFTYDPATRQVDETCRTGKLVSFVILPEDCWQDFVRFNSTANRRAEDNLVIYGSVEMPKPTDLESVQRGLSSAYVRLKILRSMIAWLYRHPEQLMGKKALFEYFAKNNIYLLAAALNYHEGWRSRGKQELLAHLEEIGVTIPAYHEDAASLRVSVVEMVRSSFEVHARLFEGIRPDFSFMDTSLVPDKVIRNLEDRLGPEARRGRRDVPARVLTRPEEILEQLVSSPAVYYDYYVDMDFSRNFLRLGGKERKMTAVWTPSAQGQVAEIFGDNKMVLHPDAAAYDFLRTVREALLVLFPENFCGFSERPLEFFVSVALGIYDDHLALEVGEHSFEIYAANCIVYRKQLISGRALGQVDAGPESFMDWTAIYQPLGLALLILAKIPFIFEDGHRPQLLAYRWDEFWQYVCQAKASGRLPVFLACP